MNKHFTLICLATTFIFTGCVSKLNYKSDSMIDSTKQYNVDIRVTRTTDPGFFRTDVTNEVTLFINDEVALKGYLTENQEGELQGMYNNEKLTLDCSKDNFFTPSFCTVLLGKKRIGESELKIFHR